MLESHGSRQSLLESSGSKAVLLLRSVAVAATVSGRERELALGAAVSSRSWLAVARTAASTLPAPGSAAPLAAAVASLFVGVAGSREGRHGPSPQEVRGAGVGGDALAASQRRTVGERRRPCTMRRRDAPLS